MDIFQLLQSSNENLPEELSSTSLEVMLHVRFMVSTFPLILIESLLIDHFVFVVLPWSINVVKVKNQHVDSIYFSSFCWINGLGVMLSISDK